MLEVNNLFVYLNDNREKRYLLSDICFNLKDGKSLGIIGKSGDGKSTLAKSLLQIYDNNIFCESSSILIDNIPFTPSMRGTVISILFQNPNSYLNPLMKIGKQIEEMLTYHKKLSKNEAKKLVLDFMQKVNLPNPEKLYNYYPYEISGGMQQKVCLCIALICKPKILIIDEGTSYLDFKSKTEILTLIKRFQKEWNFSLILISHDLNEIYAMCNNIAVMQNGILVELGKKDEIILNPVHPYTIELLLNYFQFYDDTSHNCCDYVSENVCRPADITMVSDTHYVRINYLNNKNVNCNILGNFKTIKEKIYENLRTEKLKYLPSEIS